MHSMETTGYLSISKGLGNLSDYYNWLTHKYSTEQEDYSSTAAMRKTQ